MCARIRCEHFYNYYNFHYFFLPKLLIIDKICIIIYTKFKTNRSVSEKNFIKIIFFLILKTINPLKSNIM